MAKLEVFVGGLPAGIIFEGDMNDLEKIVENSIDEGPFKRKQK